MAGREITTRRRAFTLVELLVVMSVVVLLVSISFSALANSMSAARTRATQATLLKIHGLLQQRVEAMNRYLDRLNLQPAIDKLKTDLGIANTGNALVYTILARKQIYQARFPQSFYEYDISDSAKSTGKYASSHSRQTESAALLYWFLTKSEMFGIAPVDATDFSTSEARDTDNDGLLEFVDSWGRPLRFYRWPTHLIRPGSSTGPVAPGISNSASPFTGAPIDRTYVSILWEGLPQMSGTLDPLARDPDDPTGELLRFVNGCVDKPLAMRVLQNRFHTPDTFHAFLVMSAGPDGILGIGEPYDFGTTSATTGTNAPGPDTTTGTLVGVAGSGALLSTYPVLAYPAGQGRLASLLSYDAIKDNPINDNLTNRKRQ